MATNRKTRKKKILFADDDIFRRQPFIEILENDGYNVFTTRSGRETLKTVINHRGKFDMVVLDIMMPRESTNEKDPTIGYRTGLWVAQELKKRYGNIKLMGFSALGDRDVVQWFKKYGVDYIRKPALHSEVLGKISRAIYGRSSRRLKAFIVHGHNESTLTDLLGIIGADDRFDSPVVLRDRPNLGRTIVEKFEDEAEQVDLVFVLLTPDDIAYSKRTPNQERRRSRQNVIFELGYFLGKFQRTSGRIILCYKGILELPSDISGVIYIDISKGGIKSALKKIDREISALM